MRKRTLGFKLKLSLIMSVLLFVGLILFSQQVSAYQVNLFEDNFNDNSLDPSKWTAGGTGGSYSETDGQMKFTIVGYGYRYLNSKNLNVSDWTSIAFSGKWYGSLTTAAPYILIFNASNLSKYFKVEYDSSSGELQFKDSGTPYTITRDYPTSFTDFSLNFTDSGWEYYEGGSLVKNFSSPSMSGVSDFFVRIGGWDSSTSSGQYVYFDDISVDADVIPEPTTMMLLGSLATGLFGMAGLRRRFSKR